MSRIPQQQEAADSQSCTQSFRDRLLNSSGAHRTLRAAFLTPVWPPDSAANGIVTYVDEITEALRRLGHAPQVIASRYNGAKCPPEVNALESQKRSLIARIHDGLTFRIDPFMALRQRYGRALVRTARHAIATRGVELLEMEETFGLVQLVRSHLAIPIVIRLHGPHFANGLALGLPQNALFYQRVFHEGIGIEQADAVSAPSRDVLERTRAYYGLKLSRAVIIPNACPIVPSESRWSIQRTDMSRLLFVGRFNRHKGGDLVIDAFRRVAQRARGVRLWFVGPDEGMTDEQGRHWTLKKYIAERAPDVAGRIDWLGRQPGSLIAELRRKAYVTVVGSRYENFPMVVLEAMAFGSPLVATRTGGIVEIVEDGVNGILVDPGNCEELAACILSLLEAPELAMKLGEQAAKDVAERYHPDVIARKTAQFHQEVLDRWRMTLA